MIPEMTMSDFSAITPNKYLLTIGQALKLKEMKLPEFAAFVYGSKELADAALAGHESQSSSDSSIAIDYEIYLAARTVIDNK